MSLDFSVHSPFQVNKSIYGVDLGTSSIKIYSQRKKEIKIEKNMIAMRNKDQVLAIGNDAYEMFEKTPANIEVTYPVTYGKIANLNHVEIVLHSLLYEMDQHAGRGAVIYFSVPMNMSEIDRRAYYALAHAGIMKNPKVFLVERPICDAIALGIPISRTKGSMIVNMGGQSTDISIIAHDQVIISKTIPIGGKQLNEAICEAIRRKCNLLIGRKTAKRLKIAMGNFRGEKKEARKIVGVDTLTGLPKEVVVSSALVNGAMEEEIRTIATELKTFIERIPPQIAESVEKEGIYLTGGTTRMYGIDKYIEKFIGYPIRIPSYYDLCTIKGLEELINHNALHKWANSMKEKR